jgi:hypothetical protein
MSRSVIGPDDDTSTEIGEERTVVSSDPSIVTETADVSFFYKQFILDQQPLRLALYFKMLGHNQQLEHIQQHLLAIKKEGITSHMEIALLIVADMAIFPELYIKLGGKLDPFFTLIDQQKDLQVYYLSSALKSYTKAHGAVVIGSTSLQQGIALSGGGDTLRGKMKIPDAFRYKLLNFLGKTEKWSVDLTERFGSPEELHKNLSATIVLEQHNTVFSGEINIWQEQWFDAYSLDILVATCLPEDIDGFRRELLYNKSHDVQQGLWSRPRSKLQGVDTGSFNEQFPEFLRKDRAGISCFSHCCHFFTRKVAIREQEMSSGTVLQRWLELEAVKSKLDQSRSLFPAANPTVSHFDLYMLDELGGNCNVVSSHILGQSAKVASFFNYGSDKGAKFTMPKI